MSAAEHFAEGERLLDLAASTASREASAVYAARAQGHLEAASTILMAESLIPSVGYDLLKRGDG